MRDEAEEALAGRPSASSDARPRAVVVIDGFAQNEVRAVPQTHKMHVARQALAMAPHSMHRAPPPWSFRRCEKEQKGATRSQGHHHGPCSGLNAAGHPAPDRAIIHRAQVEVLCQALGHPSRGNRSDGAEELMSLLEVLVLPPVGDVSECWHCRRRV